MSDLRLPFWVVTHRTNDCPPSVFTTTDKLTQFFAARDSGSWKLTLVADADALLFAVADAHQAGSTLARLDPEPEGSESDSVRLVDLLELAEKSRSHSA